jgi:hypothetical protein
MKVLFYLGHPAHFHLFKEVIKKLKNKGHEITLVLKTKDVLEDLVKNEGWNYYNLSPKERRGDKVSILFNLLKREFNLLKIVLKNKQDIMVGTSADITHIGKLMSIPSIVVNEDDADVVPFFAKMAYPWASCILAPSCCNVGKWKYKTVNYEGYHELAYLHPNYFTPDKRKVEGLFDSVHQKIFLIRFSSLAAHHDIGKTGITDEIAEKIIDLLLPYGKVYITSERKLKPLFEKFKLPNHPSDIHHVLSFAEVYIGDSQTMAAEAAVLGTPSIRFNDFVGELSYLDELEKKYELTYGIRTSEHEKLFNIIRGLVVQSDLKKIWQSRRDKMLSEKIDVGEFITCFIEKFPQSIKKS